jgi:hypothetical protein
MLLWQIFGRGEKVVEKRELRKLLLFQPFRSENKWKGRKNEMGPNGIEVYQWVGPTLRVLALPCLGFNLSNVLMSSIMN